MKTLTLKQDVEEISGEERSKFRSLENSKAHRLSLSVSLLFCIVSFCGGENSHCRSGILQLGTRNLKNLRCFPLYLFIYLFYSLTKTKLLSNLMYIRPKKYIFIFKKLQLNFIFLIIFSFSLYNLKKFSCKVLYFLYIYTHTIN